MTLTLCGEMANRPLEAMALIGLGFRRISMSPAAIGPVKMMLRSLDAAHLERFMESLYLRGDASLRVELEEFAKNEGVLIG